MSVVIDNLPRDDQRTPEDWRDILIGRLNMQATSALIFEDYYDGRHPLQFATSKFREAFGNLFRAFSDNWCQIVVDAAVERLRVVGFQVEGKQSTDAWDIWQENALDIESVIAHTEAGKSGACYLLVDPNDGEPLITVEHAAQVVVATDPANRRRRVAALKRWLGDDGHVYVNLYLPDVVFKFESKEPAVGAGSASSSRVELIARNGDAMTPNTLGVVPVIPLANKPGLIDGGLFRRLNTQPAAGVTGMTLVGGGHSDLEPAVPLQNAVNKLCSDLIVASEYGSFPQRVLTGVEVPRDPETGQPLAAAEMKAAMSRLWSFKPADARVTSLPAADLSNFTNAIEMLIQHLAAQTRTPPHYLLAKLVNTSGDALSVAEAGLVSKCRAKILFFSDAWEEALALALQAAGADKTAADCEAVWSNPERVQIGALTDAAVKKKTLGVPLPIIWLELGYTPEQITEMEALEESAREERLAAAAAAQAAQERLSAQVVPPGETSTAPAAPHPPPAGGQTPPSAPPTTGGPNA